MLLLIAVGPGLSGCGSNQLLTHRALVLALGFGPGPHKRDLALYMQIPTPQGLASVMAGGAAGGSGGGSSKKTTVVLKGTGATVAKAFAQIQAESNQDLYLGQLQAEIFSTQLSQAQMEVIGSTLTRLGQVDKTAYALAATAPLDKVLHTEPAVSPMAPLYYATEFSCSACQTVRLDRRIWSVEKRMAAPAVDLWLPLLKPEKAAFQLDQAVLYHHLKAHTILTPEKTELLGYLLGRTEKGFVDVPWHGFPVSIRGMASRTHFSTQWPNGHLHITVHMHIMGEANGFPINRKIGWHVPWMQAAVSRQIANRELRFLESMSRENIDVLNLGEAYLWQHPHQGARWSHAYRHAQWTVHATTTLSNLGEGT